MKRSLEQRRAKDTLHKIKGRLKDFKGKKKNRERYLSRAKSLPAMIVMCGLGQTAATLLSVGKGKKDNPDQMLYDDLASWLCKGEDAPYKDETDLIKAIVEGDRKIYIKAQVEAIKWLEWLKKFATAYLSFEEAECDDPSLQSSEE